MRKTLFQRETEGKALEIHRGSDGMTENVEKVAGNALRSNTGLQIWGSLPEEQKQTFPQRVSYAVLVQGPTDLPLRQTHSAYKAPILS